MKLHIYKNTPFGLERVNDNALTIEEAKAVIRANPTLTMRDAESQSYEALLVPLEEPGAEVLTSQEVAIAKNFKIGLVIALGLSIMAFLIERI